MLVFAEGVVQMHGENNLTERKVAKFEIDRGSSTGRGAPALICSVLVSKAGSDRVLLQKLRETERNAAARCGDLTRNAHGSDGAQKSRP